MPNETQDLTPGRASLDELLAQIVAAEEAGQPLDRQALLDQHPEHAAEMAEFLANRDAMQRLAAPLRDPPTERTSGHPLSKVRYFGDYELLEEIAAGGMGIVYKARQVSLNRIVAVKMILRGTLATEDDVKRFRAEAEAAANLQHPGIVAIHEVGIHEGQHYFSMDYVDGQSLGQLPREKPLSARQAAEYVREAAVAVHAAHQQGTLHRDLKPSNILIDRQWRVRITDFGLAKRIEGNSDLTITGQILGTPSYMPPEQALGKRSLIGTASDVYSLGAVLYELLAGRPPFRGESPAETLRQVETLDPIAPRLLNPTTPRDLETICLKCLDKEPHKRYPTAQHLADDLGRFLRGEPIHARPSRAWQRAFKWARRHPTAAGLLVMSTIALIATVGWIAGLAYNARLKALNDQLASAKGSLESRNQELETAKASLESSNKKLGETSGKLEVALADVKAERTRARRYLYAARMALVQRAQEANQPWRVVQLLRSVIPETPDQEDLREFEWYHLWRKYHGEQSRLCGHARPVTAVAISPDNKWIASGSADHTIKIWDASTGRELHTLNGHTEGVNAMAFSLDGQQLVSLGFTATPWNPKVWDFKAGKEIVQFDAGGNLATVKEGYSQFWNRFGGEPGPHWHREGNETIFDAASASRNRTVEGSTRLIGPGEPRTGKVTVADAGVDSYVFVRELPTGVTRVACTSDGSTIAAAGEDLAVRVWDVATGAEICLLQADREVHSIAFSPDGSRIVAGTESGTVMVWSLPGTEARTIHQDSSGVTCISFGAQGELLAGVSSSGAHVWDAITGRELWSHQWRRGRGGRPPPAPYVRINISPNSGWIAGAPPGSIIEPITGRQVVNLSNTHGDPYGCVFSNDETLVAQAGEMQVGIWSTASGRQLHNFYPGRWPSCCAFSPNNMFFAAGWGAGPNDDPVSLRVWETATGRSISLEPDSGVGLGVWGVAFSPDGKLLAAAMGFYHGRENQAKVCVWETATWHVAFELHGHSQCVWCVAFSPSGQRLASAGAKWPSNVKQPSDEQSTDPQTSTATKYAPGEVIIWDAVTGDELLTLRDERGGFFGVAFSPDGRLMATASQTGEVKLLDGTPLAETPAYEPLPDKQ